MTEQRQAEALARWLSQGGEVPDEVGDDVAEAVLALRPDLAPPPSLSIDDVLDSLTAGPLAADREGARRLAAWLDAGELPEEDEDELDAVFALRPDLAPAARVSIDDILGAVREGPLAERSAGAPEPTLPASIGELPEPVVVANTVPREHRRLPPWFLPGAGVMLMAALALLVVLPVKDQAPSAEPAPLAASAPAERPVGLEMVPEATTSPTTPTSPQPSPAQGVGAAREQAAGDLASDGLNAQLSSPAEEKAPVDAPARDITTLDLAPRAAEGGGPSAAPAPFVADERLQKDEASKTLSNLGYVREMDDAEVVLSQPGTVSGGAGLGTVGGASSDDEDDEPVIAEAQRSSRASSSRSYQEADEALPDHGSSTRSLASHDSGRKGNDKPKAAKPSAPAAQTAATPAQQTDGDAALAAADAELARGDASSAERDLARLLSSADPRIAKQAALRLGRLYLDQGRRPEALSVVRQAIALGDLPVEEQAKLRALEAEITR